MAAVELHDLEGIVAKRKSDPYRRGVKWWKVLNRAYSQAGGGTSYSMAIGAIEASVIRAAPLRKMSDDRVR
jgi:hypothetical protein